MSSKELRRILENEKLSYAERSRQLRKDIKSLYEQIDPNDESAVDLDCGDISKLGEYLAATRDRNVLNELLALLRNVVPFNRTLRAELIGSSVNGTLADVVFESPLIEGGDPETVTSYHRFFQYIANYVASDDAASEYLFRQLFLCDKGALAFLHVLASENEKLVHVALSVLNRMLRGESNWSAFLDLEGYFVEFTSVLIKETLRNSDSDAFELLKKVVESPRLFSVHFDRFDVQSRSFFLDLVSEQLTELHPDAPIPSLPEESLQFCIKRVKDHIEMLRKDGDRDRNEAGEVLFIKFITVLALSSLKDSRGIIKNDLELLIMSIECLRTVHALGKKDTDGFEPKTDFESLAGNKGEIFEHPLFGLKRDLVRLIGNMCYKNKRNQDTLRDFNGIELLCDMSSLDARNPFITQWVVLALKNLMDDNQENQKIVASLTRKTDA